MLYGSIMILLIKRSTLMLQVCKCNESQLAQFQPRKAACSNILVIVVIMLLLHPVDNSSNLDNLNMTMTWTLACFTCHLQVQQIHINWQQYSAGQRIKLMKWCELTKYQCTGEWRLMLLLLCLSYVDILHGYTPMVLCCASTSHILTAKFV